MVNYEFYTCDYRGSSIDVHAWPQFEARAAEQLARYKRIYSVKAPGENSEALAICAMAEALYGFTLIANRRLTRYMPASQSEVLSAKLKYVKSPTEIEVLGPYARYQYYGKVMVNAKTGKGPALIPGGGYRYRKGTVLKVTDRDLKYDRTKHPEAGPYWDRRMMAAEKSTIAAETQAYVRSRK